MATRTDRANRAGQWSAGQSGNPRGRPRKGGALAEIIAQVGDSPLLVNGERTTRKELLAKVLWNLIAHGRASLPVGDAVSMDGNGKPIINLEAMRPIELVIRSHSEWLEAVNMLAKLAGVYGEPGEAGALPVPSNVLQIIVHDDNNVTGADSAGPQTNQTNIQKG